MTDIELAEEYYYKNYPVTLNIGEEERKQKVIDTFLAGLKADVHTDNSKVIAELEAENENLKARLIAVNLLIPELEKHSEVKRQRLAGAEEVIKLLLWDLQNKDANPAGDIAIAKLFLEEVEDD